MVLEEDPSSHTCYNDIMMSLIWNNYQKTVIGFLFGVRIYFVVATIVYKISVCNKLGFKGFGDKIT